jgi:hypothetical protein
MTDLDWFDLLNLLIVVAGVVSIYFGIKISIIMNKFQKSYWWYILPFLLVYALANSIAIFILGVYNNPLVNAVVGLDIVFWIGVAAFIYMVERAAERVLPGCK